MAYELKPCPFCGGDVLNVTKDSFYHILQCDQCGVEKAHTRKHKLIKGWNRRADLARPKVKPLEWVTLPWSTDSVFYCFAESSFGDFGYGLDNGGNAYYAVPDQEGFIEAENPEAAKAAAQEDYERRILAALEGE